MRILTILCYFQLTDKPTLFDELVYFIKVRIPPLHVPWLQPTKDVSEQSEEAYHEVDSEDENWPGIEKMHEKPQKKVRKLTKNAEKLNTQPSVIRNVAVDTERLTENSGIALEYTENLKANTPVGLENTGQPGKEQLPDEELKEVRGTIDSPTPGFKRDSTVPENENIGKKKRRRRNRRNKGKKKTSEAPMQLVYLKPCIKSFDTTPKDKGDQTK